MGMERLLAGIRVAVVEDNAWHQEITRELLEAHGARVQVYGSGEEALPYLADHSQALVADYMLDHINGRELIELAQTRFGFPREQALIHTSHTPHELHGFPEDLVVVSKSHHPGALVGAVHHAAYGGSSRPRWERSPTYFPVNGVYGNLLKTA